MANKNKTKSFNIIATVIAIVLIVVIVPLLAISVTLIIKGSLNSDYPPDIFGYAPLTVASGSMSGESEDSFDEGDLIFVKILSDDEKQLLAVDDVICYKVDDIFVTHRIKSITYNTDGTIASLITRGDANNTDDSAITLSSIFGIYTGKIANLGSFAEFLQSPAGIAVFVGVPVAAFVFFDVTRVILLNRNKNNDQKLQNKEQELQSKEEEIARLKSMLDKQNASASVPTESAEPAETAESAAEPAETAESAAEPAETAESAEPAETAETTEADKCAEE